MGIRCADHATTSIRKRGHKLRRQAAVTRSVGIVRWRTKTTEFVWEVEIKMCSHSCASFSYPLDVLFNNHEFVGAEIDDLRKR
jgi:hypothetical protein